MKLVTVIVTFNGGKWIDKCFGSLIQSTILLKVIAIDNGSTDGTPDLIRGNYPQVEVIEIEKNLGFTKANNIGIRYALQENADYIFLLNQDAWIKPDTIEKLIAIFNKSPDAGIVSPMHLNGDASGLDKAFASYLSPYNTPNIISDLFLNRLKGYYKTEFVNAAAWLISKKCIEKVGAFDSSLFTHYGEDDNYCQRARYHGFGIYISTETIICHDREDLSSHRPKIFAKNNKNLSRKIYYSNPFFNDSVVIKQLDLLMEKRNRNVIKYTLTFSLKRLNNFLKEHKKETEFFKTVMTSRESYKTNGLKWLDNISD